MNFFGHAHLARRRSSAPRFVLGAMLPDLANMVGTRLIVQSEPEIRAGVQDHHRVDDVFHQAPTFVALTAEAYRELSARGLGWGSARAVAHVATELFLDGTLEDHAPTKESYRGAIDGARVAVHDLVLAREAERERFARLFTRLGEHALPARYQDPVFVREVMVRILEHRPRLALTPADLPVLDDYLPQLRRVVERDATQLLEEVRGGLVLADQNDGRGTSSTDSRSSA